MNIVPTRYRYVTTTLLIGSVVLLVFAYVLQVTSIPVEERGRGTGSWETPADTLMWGLMMLVAALIGAGVARNQPHNPIGWFFSIGGFIGVFAVAADQWGAYALIIQSGTVGAGTTGFILSFSGLYVSWCLLGVFVPVTFPDGSLHGRFRKVVAAAGALSALLWILEALRPDAFTRGYYAAPELLRGVENPIGIPGTSATFELLNTVGIFGLFGAMFLALGSLLPRVFRARGIERQQLKVVAYAALLTTVGMLIGANALNIEGIKGTALESMINIVLTVLVLLLPASFGVAVLRYRLYDIDVVINKTLVYGLLATFITTVYVVVVVGVGSVLGARGEPNLVLSVVATAVVAVAFQPVREIVQRFANRLVYGRRATPDDLMKELAPVMATAISADEVLPPIAHFAARSVGGDAARVTLLLPQGRTLDRTWPTDGGAGSFDASADVVHSGQKIGEISVRKPRGDAVTTGDRRTLVDFAEHVGIPLSSVRLSAELRQKLDEISAHTEELRRSRLRIVEASDDARRRIERNLHDGAQQRLVALGLELKTLETKLPPDDPARQELQKASQDLRDALTELRELARGIHPAILVEQGLGAALESLVSRSTVDAELVEAPEDRLPPHVEAAAYYAVAEALTNVSRYAQATSAVVTARQDGDELTVEVADDGVGGADMTRGSGLRGLADRVATLDGTLEVDSPAGGGTRVVVRIPCV